MYIKISVIVEKAAPGHDKGFFWTQSRSSISELSVGKILTVHHHGIEKKFHYDGFEINSERDIKSVLQIDY